MKPEGPSPISPAATLQLIAEAIPDACRHNLVIVGSLAVGYYFFRDQEEMVVRTKEADCLLSPRVEAVPAGVAVTERLLDAGWRFRPDKDWSEPGDEQTPDHLLPVLRLHPPGTTEWFLELLTVPESPQDRRRGFMRIKTRYGHFGLVSFGFLSLTSYGSVKTEFGIAVARPEMMALANLLEHPRIGPEVMSGLFAGREIKRSNKDLGRVLAIAHLATARDPDSLAEWPALWLEALRNRFPDEWADLIGTVGAGITELLQQNQDLTEAHHTCVNGLLASRPPSVEALRIAGLRLIQDAVEPLMGVADRN